MTNKEAIDWLDVLKSEIEDYNLRDEYNQAIDLSFQALEKQEARKDITTTKCTTCGSSIVYRRVREVQDD